MNDEKRPMNEKMTWLLHWKSQIYRKEAKLNIEVM